MKVDVPRFSSEDAEDWIFKIKEFFKIYGVPVEQRTKIASFHMEGPAYSWYKWVVKNQLVQTWNEFLTALQLMFGTSLYDDPKAALKELKQTSTIAEYQSMFEDISMKVTRLSEQWLISLFIAGLQEQLKCELLLAQPETYYQAVSLAKLYEQKVATMQNTFKGNAARGRSTNSGQKSIGGNSAYFLPNNNRNSFQGTSNSRGPSYSNSFKQQSSNSLPSISTGSNAGSSSTTSIKRLTTTEIKARRKKGLCYYCDEKYQPNHKCKVSCYLLVGPEELDEMVNENLIEENAVTEEESSQLHVLDVAPDISLNALAGQFHPNTLRVLGRHGKKHIKILVDNGSNNNFINPDIAAKLNLPQTPITKFKVGTGSGNFLVCNKKCERVPIIIQGHEFTVDLFVLEIKGSDIVLGVQWLIELGTIKTNYQELTMEFCYKGADVKLQGENILNSTSFKGKKLGKLANSENLSEFYQLNTVYHTAQENVGEKELPYHVTELVLEYSDVFQEPKGLPPRREIDHRIPLEPNSKPVNVRPYRYPHFQKNEMERLVTEMQEAGIIREQ